MKYIINQEEIEIPIEKKELAKGSEGKVYKIDNSIYKIYYPQAINEGYGNKQNIHSYLTTIKPKQFIFPDSIIWNQQGEYAGYKTKYIKEDKKDKTGITLMPSKDFIKNLQIIESDIDLLSKNFILMADVTPVNYIFDKENNTMNIIDPGRYRLHKYETIEEHQKINTIQYNYLIELLLYLDFIKNKPIGSKRKELKLKEYIIEEFKKRNTSYSEFFKEKLSNFSSVDEYVKTLGKYIK